MTAHRDPETNNTRNLRVIGGEWRIARRLGRGGTANVYLAVHIHDGTRAALKILRRELLGQKLLERRFLREAELTAKVRHPCVLGIHGHGRGQDGRPFIVAELLEGETLDERRIATKGKRLDWQDVVAVGLKVLDALAAAHDVGVVHRDVKPTNIFVTKEGEVKLLDFGIAGLGEDDSVLQNDNTRTALGIGTPLFMAPEQLTGDDAIDGRADQFGLAASLFHAMSGRVPFGTSSFSVGALIAAYSGGPADLRELVPDVPRPVARVITRALAMRPRERFANAREMKTALENATTTALAPPKPATKAHVWLDQTAPLPTVRKMQVAVPAAPRTPAMSFSGTTPPSGAPAPAYAMRAAMSSSPGAAAQAITPGAMRSSPPSSPPGHGSTPPVRSVPPPAPMRASSEDLAMARPARATSTRPHPGPPPAGDSAPTAPVRTGTPASVWIAVVLVGLLLAMLTVMALRAK